MEHLGGTLFANGLSTGHIGGAIAEAILHDIRNDHLGLAGFPRVRVTRASNGFHIALNMGEHTEGFEITDAEAKSAVSLMQSRKGHSADIFERVQNALAGLEGATR